MWSPRLLKLAALALSLAAAGAVNGTLGSDFAYYKLDGANRSWADTNTGASGLEWAAPDSAARNDMVLFAPSLSQLRVPEGGQWPADGEFYLADDAVFVVVIGNATFGASPDSGMETHGYGDAFWIMAGHSLGPIVNTGTGDLVVDVVAGTATGAAALGPIYGTAPEDNPSTDSSLTTSRSYRRVDADWSANPSDHTDECLANGGVYNMAFNENDNSPCVLRVKWAANCSIPYHYHPTGALYFILYGQMFFDGDVPANDPLYEMAFDQGEVRWVRPGFDYGPEYNGDAVMEITVLGTDTNPQFGSPPDGKYVVQKSVVNTHVYEL